MRLFDVEDRPDWFYKLPCTVNHWWGFRLPFFSEVQYYEKGFNKLVRYRNPYYIYFYNGGIVIGHYPHTET